jgi:hypothetical protein
VDVRRPARDERADFAAPLATLSPRQWLAPTLCARWLRRTGRAACRHTWSGADSGPDRINAAALARYNTRTPEQLLALLAGHLQPGGCPRRWAAGSR